jgi:hypothetical protein
LGSYSAVYKAIKSFENLIEEVIGQLYSPHWLTANAGDCDI